MKVIKVLLILIDVGFKFDEDSDVDIEFVMVYIIVFIELVDSLDCLLNELNGVEEEKFEDNGGFFFGEWFWR